MDCVQCHAAGSDMRAACGCVVHVACFEERIALCTQARLKQFLCARCWRVAWSPGKRKRED